MSRKLVDILDENESNIRKMLAENRSQREIGEHFGVSQRLVGYWMKRVGVVQGNKLAPYFALLHANEAEIREMFDQNVPRPEIAKRFGVSIKVVQKWRSQIGAPTFDRRGRVNSPNTEHFLAHRSEIEGMLAAGHSVAEISQRVGIPYADLYYRLHRFGMVTPTRSYPTLPVEGRKARARPIKDILKHHEGEIRQMFAAGETYDSIAKRFDISRTSVRRIRHLLGIPLPEREMVAPILKEKGDEIRRLIEDDGILQRDIAERFGVTKNVVQTWRSKLGIAPRQPKGRFFGEDTRTFIENRDEIERMFHAGHSVMEIAIHFRVSYHGIYYALRRFRIAASAKNRAKNRKSVYPAGIEIEVVRDALPFPLPANGGDGIPFLKSTDGLCRRPLWHRDEVVGNVCGRPTDERQTYCDGCSRRLFLNYNARPATPAVLLEAAE